MVADGRILSSGRHLAENDQDNEFILANHCLPPLLKNLLIIEFSKAISSLIVMSMIQQPAGSLNIFRV